MANEDTKKNDESSIFGGEREDYDKTAETYTEKIAKDPDDAENYSERCRAYMKLDKLDEALADADKAIQLGLSTRKIYFRRALTLYYKRNYSEAKEAFQKAEDAEKSEIPLKAWRDKCDDELLRVEEERKLKEPKIAPKVKLDWYQTDNQVVINLLVKNVKKEDVTVDITEECVSCDIAKLPDDSEEQILTYCLLHKIDPKTSSYRVLTTKIEIKLPKREAIRWEKLEDDKKKKLELTEAQKRRNARLEKENVPKNWDKIINQMVKDEEEKLEGDGAINHLFQKIYSEGSDEVKMAMNKSFMESGGTVLSTNWSEVGSEKVEVKPPDGMEWREYRN